MDISGNIKSKIAGNLYMAELLRDTENESKYRYTAYVLAGIAGISCDTHTVYNREFVTDIITKYNPRLAAKLASFKRFGLVA